jgi:hypothetical protein
MHREELPSRSNRRMTPMNGDKRKFNRHID